MEWTSTPHTATNSSTVTASVFLDHYEIYSAALSGSYVKIGGEVTYFSKAVNQSASGKSSTHLCDFTAEVSHMTDGTASVTLEAGWVFRGTYSGVWIGTLTASKTVTLDLIRRASELSFYGDVTLTEKKTFGVSSFDPSFSHSLVMTVGGRSAEVPVSSGGVTPPASLALGMTEGTQKTGTVSLRTYDGNGNVIGESAVKNCLFRVPSTEEFLPDFEFSAAPRSDHPALPEEGIFAAKISKAAVTVTGKTAKQGATVAQTQVAVGPSVLSDNKTGKSEFEKELLTAGDITVSVTVTDSRGLSKRKSTVITVAPYSRPAVTEVTCKRCDGEGKDGDGGKYFKVKASFTVSALGGINTAALTVRYKKHSGGTWSALIPLESGKETLFGGSLTPIVSYDVEIGVTDTLGNAGTWKTTLLTEKVDFHLNGDRARFGGYCERAGLECDWDCNFGKEVFIKEKKIADHVTETGRDGIWRYRRFASGDAECFGVTEEASVGFSGNFGGLFKSASPVGAANYPEGLFSAPPAVTASPVSETPVILCPAGTGDATGHPGWYVLSSSGSAASVSVAVSAKLSASAEG